MTPGSADEGSDREAPLPWCDWAARLSLAYGWTPRELGRMTIAQLSIWLNGLRGDGRSAGSPARMSPAEGRLFCQRRNREKQTWIQRTMKEIHRAG